MADQLSLFPEKDLRPETIPSIKGDIGALDEMFISGSRFRERNRFVEMLRFIFRFPGYSPFNGFLLYLQNPEATLVATAGAWKRRFGREIRPDAHPLMILAPMAPVRFLFDVADTRGPSPPPEGRLSGRLSDRGLEDVFRLTVGNCTFHGIAVREVPAGDQRAGQAAALTYNTRKLYRDLSPQAEERYLIVVGGEGGPSERYHGLCRGLGHVFCGHLGIDSSAWWQDRRGVDVTMADTEADAIACLALARRGLDEQPEKYLAAWARRREPLLPVFSLNGVLGGTQYIEEMGKTRWRAPGKKGRYR
jgi:hypothetical protein